MPIRVAAALLLAAAAGALSAAADDGRHGFLATGVDVLPAIPPAPRPGDARDAADRRIFRETRALVGNPRYLLATSDVDYRPAALGHDFSCAAGVTLAPASAPKTFALVARASVDTGRAMIAAKDYYKRPRPYRVDRGPTCQPPAELGASYDYPSGHATLGWTWGYVLADLLPDRAGAILARARAFADSRYICGVHSYSATVAGQATAAATMTAVRQTPAYHADLKRARRELAKLAADPRAPQPAGCDAERALTADPSP